ncbi:MAG: hypothetical protein LBT92_00925 [Rickettsiales bacterium]|jgi:hypothetical protein|nr:hypothetical protein [Rickettsiales bacterium]
MPYEKENTSVSYKADGSSVEFEFPFRIFRPQDVKVEIDDDPVEEGFSVAGDKVVFAAPPPAGSDISIRRFLDFTRIGAFTAGGPFRAEDVNTEFEYTRACIRQIFDTDLADAVAFVEDCLSAIEEIYGELTDIWGGQLDCGGLADA